MNHDLKTAPEYFCEVLNGNKSFEIRKDDRGFEVGDTLTLKEYLIESNEYTGRQIKLPITYILRNYPAIQTGYAVIGFNRFESQIKAKKVIFTKIVELLFTAELREVYRKQWESADKI